MVRVYPRGPFSRPSDTLAWFTCDVWHFTQGYIYSIQTTVNNNLECPSHNGSRELCFHWDVIYIVFVYGIEDVDFWQFELLMKWLLSGRTRALKHQREWSYLKVSPLLWKDIPHLPFMHSFCSPIIHLVTAMELSWCVRYWAGSIVLPVFQIKYSWFWAFAHFCGIKIFPLGLISSHQQCDTEDGIQKRC